MLPLCNFFLEDTNSIDRNVSQKSEELVIGNNVNVKQNCPDSVDNFAN